MTELSFRESLWDSFETICTRMQDGSTYCKAYAKFFTDFSKETREYSRKLAALTKGTQEETATLNLGWLAMKQDIETLANHLNKLADDVNFRVAQPVENYVKETSKMRKKSKDSGRKLINDLTESVKTVSAAKGDYEKQMRLLDQAKAEHERAASLNELYNSTKVKKKLDSDRKKAESADKKYKKAVEKAQVLEIRMFDTDMPNLLSEFEAMEKTRINTVKSSLESFRMAYCDFHPQVAQLTDKMASDVNIIDAEEDVAEFIRQKATGKQKEETRTRYEPYNPQFKACVREGAEGSPGLARPASAIGGGMAAASMSAGSLRQSGSFVAPDQSQSAPNVAGNQQAGMRMSQAMAAPVAPAGEICKCVGLHDYTAAQPTELSFKKGDIISVLEKDTSGWWVGRVGSSMGFFPSVDWVEELPAQEQQKSLPALPPTPQPLPPTPSPQQAAPPTYNSNPSYNSNPGYPSMVAPGYQQQMPVQMPVQVQQPMAQAPQPPAPAAPAAMPAGRRCKVLFQMDAVNANELSLREGEILTIESEADGWYFGHNDRGQTGIFPACFITLDV